MDDRTPSESTPGSYRREPDPEPKREQNPNLELGNKPPDPSDPFYSFGSAAEQVPPRAKSEDNEGVVFAGDLLDGGAPLGPEDQASPDVSIAVCINGEVYWMDMQYFGVYKTDVPPNFIIPDEELE